MQTTVPGISYNKLLLLPVFTNLSHLRLINWLKTIKRFFLLINAPLALAYRSASREPGAAPLSAVLPQLDIKNDRILLQLNWYHSVWSVLFVLPFSSLSMLDCRARLKLLIHLPSILRKIDTTRVYDNHYYSLVNNVHSFPLVADTGRLSLKTQSHDLAQCSDHCASPEQNLSFTKPQISNHELVFFDIDNRKLCKICDRSQ